MTTKKKIIYYLCVLLFLSLISCERTQYLINDNKIIENEMWTVDNQLPFYFSISDTQKIYEIGFDIRYTSDYPKQNMYVFLHTIFPNGMRTHDTISVDLFSPMGEPFGKGKRVKELQQSFSYVKFYMEGDYTMTIEQAMRMDTLPGVVSFGLYITEPTNLNE